MKSKENHVAADELAAATTGRTENQKNADKHTEAAEFHRVTAILHREAQVHHQEAEKYHKESAKHYAAGHHDLAVAAAVKAYKHEELAHEHIKLEKQAIVERREHAVH